MRIFLFYCLLILSIILLMFPQAVSGLTLEELKALGLDENDAQEVLIQSSWNQETKKISSLAEEKKINIEQGKTKISELGKNIEEKKQKLVALETNKSLLGFQLDQTKETIISTKQAADNLEWEIEKITSFSKEKTGGISARQEKLEQILFLVYKQEQNDLSLFVLSREETQKRQTYKDRLLSDAQKLTNEIQAIEKALTISKRELQNKKKELQALKKLLVLEQNKKEKYQREEGGALQAIEQTQEKIQDFSLEIGLEQERIERALVEAEKIQREKLERERQFQVEKVSLEWPIANQGITAHFHDPKYLFRSILEHPGIDLRTLKNGRPTNGLTVRAAENGYIAVAQNGGWNYSYIMIVHGQNISTVYGHISKILVSEGDYVKKGQVIGLSGGAPGTRGAGYVTSGPHLHFEVRLNGVPVDPIAYLPKK